MIYIVARTAHGRPSLQHKSDDYWHTLCGLDTQAWSRAYQPTPISAILCKKCEKLG